MNTQTMPFFFIIAFLGLPSGTWSTVVFDACQNATNEAHSFRVIGSYYQDHPGICSCSIRILSFKPVTSVQEIHTRFSLQGNTCGYLIGRPENGVNDCTVCLDFSEMVFRRRENFTIFIERSSDHQPNQIWFDISIPPIDHDIWLKINCWLNERKKKTSPCNQPVESSPKANGNETSPGEHNVSAANECGNKARHDTCISGIACIFGWVIASLSLTSCFGIIVYKRIKSRKQNGQKMVSHASIDLLVVNSSPVPMEETEYVSAGYLDMNDTPVSEYQHLQFQGETVDNVYEQLDEEPRHSNSARKSSTQVTKYYKDVH